MGEDLSPLRGLTAAAPLKEVEAVGILLETASLRGLTAAAPLKEYFGVWHPQSARPLRGLTAAAPLKGGRCARLPPRPQRSPRPNSRGPIEGAAAEPYPPTSATLSAA